jgi:hypothetical protein
MIAKFKFYNVGQGTFYGGAIECNKHKFVVVYDCGSITRNNPLDQPIHEFRNEFDHIDLLIVSHFDKDHVNGIERLIHEKRVETIVLPYMPLLTRLALVASQNSDDANYISFVANPTNYLLGDRFNVGQICYVDQGGAGNNSEVIEPVDPKFDRELDDNLDFGDLSLNLPESDSEVQERILTDQPDLNDEKTRFLSFNTRLTVGKELWEFVFYHRKTQDETNITNFQTALNNFMKTKKIADIRDLFTVSRVSEMKLLYEKNINSDLNYSSLCLFHQPIFKSFLPFIVKSSEGIPERFYCRRRHPYYSNKSGTLLTGDQFLKKDIDFNSFYTFYESRMENVEIFQVPHHGSLENWKMMPCKFNKHKFGCFIINHGYGRVSHPNKLVLENLLTYSSAKVLLNNEYSNLKYVIWRRR